MKKLLAIAALLLASTAAQAQYTFEYGGRTIRVDPDRGTVSIPGVYDNTGRRQALPQRGQRPSAQTAPQQAKTDPQSPPDAPPLPPAQRRRRLSRLRSCRRSRAPAPAAPAAEPRPRGRRRARRNRTPRRRAASPAGSAGTRPRANRAARAGVAAAPPRRHPLRRLRRAGRELAARRLADGREGRQGPDRTMRRQSLRLFGRQEIEPEWRAGSDQHEARQGRQMERPDSRSEHRQHL